MRDVIPRSIRLRLIHRINRVSGNYVFRPLYGKVTYNQDGLATTHSAPFMSDPLFLEAYEAGKSTGSWTFGDLHWRAHVVCWAAERGASLSGDFVECGVNRGGYALTVIKYLGFERMQKTFYLLDTYDGLAERYISAEEKARGVRVGEYEPCYDAVVRTFAPYANTRIIKGTVPDTLPQVDTDRVAFLSLDMNTRDPEIAAAEHFWDKLASGAAIVLDDYGWRKHVEQQRAFDDFAKRRGVQVLALPTGQGLILKP
ncbi:MAG TPA: TylF/MycF/NovP-related O-methyltransferase [Acidimicrobiales bacterium]|nr:TylF/MycF/NovP-related O-methyltransferase [Acidimicrobiales bacterium]